MKAIGYVRVSTEDQAVEGLSLAAQGARLSAYCEAQGWTLTAIYRDAGVSARSLERPGLEAALEAAAAGEADVLLALKLDRLTRSVVDLYALVERCDAAGVRLAAVQDALDTGSANGRMVTSILAVLAQWEREIVSERTAAALAHKKQNGEHVGMAPYGFRIGQDRRLVVESAEMAAIQRMKRLRRRGASYQKIADRLNSEGVESRRSRWSHTAIRRLVCDHLNARKARYLNGSAANGGT